MEQSSQIKVDFKKPQYLTELDTTPRYLIDGDLEVIQAQAKVQPQKIIERPQTVGAAPSESKQIETKRNVVESKKVKDKVEINEK